jgi:hypothetical protein
VPNIRWAKDLVLLERLVRLRAEGKYLRECGEILGLGFNPFHIYHTKLAKRLCSKLGIPHFHHQRPTRETYSNEQIENWVRLRWQEDRSWDEIAQMTGYGWAAIRVNCYSRRGKEIRERLGFYRTKNLRRDLTGKKFGKLKVIRANGHSDHKNVLWLCKCSCGKFTTSSSSNLVRGLTKTCGDRTFHYSGKNNAQFKHGGPSNPKRRPTWNSYMAMLRRCFTEKDETYQWYGARGITVCAHWRGPNGFLNFLASIGRRPKNKTLDRIHPHQHYSCGSCEQCVANGWTANCRWATKKVQANNKQRNYPPQTEEEKAALLQSCQAAYDEEHPF